VTDVSLSSVPAPPAPDLSPSQAQTEACGSCGAPLASDQRYCLECGRRRGDPRLPFMDAVTLMDAVQRSRQAPPPEPPKRKRGGFSPNAALITGIGTLLLALGIGVLIGRSGTHEVAQTAAAPQVIKVGGGGGEEATASTGGSKGATTGGGTASKAKTKKQKQQALKEAEAHPAAEEVLKPAGNVDLPEATVKPGDKCKSGEAGCQGGEFTGNFFGE
jgi:hypothetical protein